MLPWLWCRPAAAALIQPLAWDLPYAAGAALNDKKKKKSGVEFAGGRTARLELTFSSV